jgi:hypothetical protein
MSDTFAPAGTAGADELVVPYVFTATAGGSQEVILYGEDITATIDEDYHITLNVSLETLNQVFTYSQPAIGSNPTNLALTLSAVVHAFNASFVAPDCESRLDDLGVAITTPYGDFRNYITNLSSWVGLHARDDAIKTKSDSHVCDSLLGEQTVVDISSATFAGALAATYERAAAAGKITASGDANVAAHWDLALGDKVTVFVKYAEEHSINYEFDSNATGSVDPSFNASALSGLESITVYYGGNSVPVTIADTSQTIHKVYKLTLVAAA